MEEEEEEGKEEGEEEGSRISVTEESTFGEACKTEAMKLRKEFKRVVKKRQKTQKRIQKRNNEA